MDREVGEGGRRAGVHPVADQVGEHTPTEFERNGQIVSVLFRENGIFSKTSASNSNLGALDNMMPRSGSRGSTPPTPGNELEDEEQHSNHKKISSLVTTPPPSKEKKKLMFKKVWGQGNVGWK